MATKPTALDHLNSIINLAGAIANVVSDKPSLPVDTTALRYMDDSLLEILEGLEEEERLVNTGGKKNA